MNEGYNIVTKWVYCLYHKMTIKYSFMDCNGKIEGERKRRTRDKYSTNKILPRGVICPSKMTRIDQKTLPNMPHSREMAISSGLIYI
jgi:hypothetical protein